MIIRRVRDTTEIMFVITLFFLYTICTMLLSMMVADTYRKGADRSERNYNMRTSVLYLTEKVRQTDAAEGISVRQTSQGDALVLGMSAEGERYETWIYVEDGYLCEVLLSKGADIAPGIGQKIMPLSSLNLQLGQEGLLQICVTDQTGETYTGKVLREAEENTVYQSSKSRYFLVELLVNCLLFAVSAAVCVAILVHANMAGKKSATLSMAVSEAQNVAESVKASGGDLRVLGSLLDTEEEGGVYILLYDANWQRLFDDSMRL